MNILKLIVTVFILLFYGIYSNGLAQNLITKSGTLEIYSNTVLLNVYGINPKVASILNPNNGEIVISTLVRSFRFKEALVEELIVEKYLEPGQYPRATFKGKIEGFQKLSLSHDGQYPVLITGTLRFHDIIHNISENGILLIHKGQISLSSKFNISLDDYDVTFGTIYSKAVNSNISILAQFYYVPKNY